MAVEALPSILRAWELLLGDTGDSARRAPANSDDAMLRTSVEALVRFAMNSLIQVSLLHRDVKQARWRAPASVPGVICRCRVGPLRWESRADPRRSSRAAVAFSVAWKYCITGGIVSATLLPTSRIASVFADVRQWERKAAIDSESFDRCSAAADDMQKRPL